MVTMFCTPKPFRGHIAIIQRNALQSWKRLSPEVEIILFGDEEGAAEACREFGLRHEPHVDRSEGGTKHVRHLFERAQKIARHDVLCYCNCDIVLLRGFQRCLERVQAWRKQFLMVGRRWDVDITEPIPFDDPRWQEQLLEFTLQRGRRVRAHNIDYFAFTKGLYADIPPLVLGRIWWDQWLVWKAGALGVPVVDATELVFAVHQNHDYSYHPLGKAGVFWDEESNRNHRIAGGWSHLHTIADASHRITSRGIRRNFWGRWAPLGRSIARPLEKLLALWRAHVWHPLLRLTAAIRHPLGLRRNNLLRPVQALKLKWTLSRKHMP